MKSELKTKDHHQNTKAGRIRLKLSQDLSIIAGPLLLDPTSHSNLYFTIWNAAFFSVLSLVELVKKKEEVGKLQTTKCYWLVHDRLNICPSILSNQDIIFKTSHKSIVDKDNLHDKFLELNGEKFFKYDGRRIY